MTSCHGGLLGPWTPSRPECRGDEQLAHRGARPLPRRGRSCPRCERAECQSPPTKTSGCRLLVCRLFLFFFESSLMITTQEDNKVRASTKRSCKAVLRRRRCEVAHARASVAEGSARLSLCVLCAVVESSASRRKTGAAVLGEAGVRSFPRQKASCPVRQAQLLPSLRQTDAVGAVLGEAVVRSFQRKRADWFCGSLADHRAAGCSSRRGSDCSSEERGSAVAAVPSLCVSARHFLGFVWELKAASPRASTRSCAEIEG